MTGRRGLPVLLVLAPVVSCAAVLLGQAVFQVQVVTEHAEVHGGTATWADFWPEFAAVVLASWQGELLQLALQVAGLVVLLRWLERRVSARAARVETKVDELLVRSAPAPQIGRRVVGPVAYRTGWKVGRTVYALTGDGPSDQDKLIGVFDTPALARFAVDSMNAAVHGEDRAVWRGR